MFREFALGFSRSLAVRDEHPFIAYYGYGAGVVRLSLGDNEEMGGANRGGGVYRNSCTTPASRSKQRSREGRYASEHH